MIIFPAQYEAYRTRGDGTRILSLSIYQDHASDVAEVINGELGREYLVIMVPTGTQEANEFISETPEQTVERFRKRMNSLINQAAEKKGLDPKKYREDFKKILIERKIIKESTKELGLEGLALVINILKNDR